MGQSTDAILFFGFDLGEDFEAPWSGEDDTDTGDDWEDVYAEKKGLERPVHLCELMKWTPDQKIEYGEWSSKKSALVKDVGVAMSSHCSCECPMHYVYSKQYMAYRGYGMIIRPVMLEVDEEDILKLREFVKFMGIDVGDEEPEWHLVSDWC